MREITQTYNSTPADGEKRWQAEALLALSAVNRFSMAVMLLGKAEKARVKAAIDAVAAAGADAERMSLVRQRYRIK